MIIKLVRFDFKYDIVFTAIVMDAMSMDEDEARQVFEVHLNADGAVAFKREAPSISDGKITEPENTDVHTRTADSERADTHGEKRG